MNKFICEISKHEELKRMHEAQEQKITKWTERSKFIFKQLNDIEQEAAKHSREHWSWVELYLKDHGLLPEDFDPEKQKLVYIADLKIIAREEIKTGHENFFNALKGLFQ